MTNSTANAEYTYKAEGDTLIINVHTTLWTVDQIPTWLGDIFINMMLVDVERIRYIHIEETQGA